MAKCLEINISDTHCPLGAAEGLHILTESLKSRFSQWTLVQEIEGFTNVNCFCGQNEVGL